MTAEELISTLNRVFGMENKWPDTFEVDSDTYANCCQYVFNKEPSIPYKALVALGANKGLMFKNVELILEEKK